MRDIKGFGIYDQYYQVDREGNVYRKDTGRKLKPKLTRDGYHELALSVGGKAMYKRVHILVARTYIDNPECKPQVNHINGDKLDNTVENLEWVTESENQIHAFRHGLIDHGSKSVAHLSTEEIKSIPDMYLSGMSIKQIAERFGLTCNPDSISALLRGERFTEITGITKSISRIGSKDNYTYTLPQCLNMVYLVEKLGQRQSEVAKIFQCKDSVVCRIRKGLRRPEIRKTLDGANHICF